MPVDGYVIWAPMKFQKELAALTKRNVTMATVYLHKRVQERVNIPTNVHGPSAPGEPPHKVRGDLQRSIYWRVRTLGGPMGVVEGEVGTKLDYAVYHEVHERSFLRSTLLLVAKKIGEILSGGIGKGGGKKTGYKYSAAVIAEVRKMAAGGMSVSEIAKKTGISRSHVAGVVKGKTRAKGK